MANKRMFSKSIVDTDAFLEMPQTSQLLYFHLAMRADDEGFVGNPKRIMKMCGFGEDDLNVLKARRFILLFDSGVVVIKHWLIHNTIRKDRFIPTNYQIEKKGLKIKENKAYTESGKPNGNQMAPQYSIDKYSIDNSSSPCDDHSPDDLEYEEVEDVAPKESPARKFTNERRADNGRPPIKKKKPTEKQAINHTAMKMLTYFREQVQYEHGELKILKKPDKNRNSKIQKLIKGVFEYFSYDEEQLKKLIDWWIAGAGEWCKYRPENCFMTTTCEDFENREFKPKIEEKGTWTCRFGYIHKKGEECGHGIQKDMEERTSKFSKEISDNFKIKNEKRKI